MNAVGFGECEHIHLAECARPDFDQRIGLVYMDDPRGVGRKPRIVFEVLTAHRLQ